MTIDFNTPNIVATETTTIIKDYGDGMVAAQHPNGYVGIFDAEMEDGSLYQISPALVRPAPGKTALEVADEMMAA